MSVINRRPSAAAGVPGPKGDQGNPGAAGAVGPQGSGGLIGPKGDKGDVGAGSASVATEPRLVALGDSITQDDAAPNASRKWVNQLTALRSWTLDANGGINGSSVATGGGTPLVNRWQNSVPANYDGHVTILIGTNDWNNNLPLGLPGSTDPASIYGALLTTARGVLGRGPLVTLHLLTPTWRGEEPGRNTAGYTLEQVRQAVRDVAGQVEREFPGQVQLVDIGRGLTDWLSAPNSAYLQNDRLHPAPAGDDLIAAYLGMNLAGVAAVITPPSTLYARMFSALAAGPLAGQDGWTVASGNYSVTASGLAVNAPFDTAVVGAQHDQGAGTRARIRVASGAAMLRFRMQPGGQYYAVYALKTPTGPTGLPYALDFALISGSSVQSWGPSQSGTPITPLPAFPYWMEIEQLASSLNVRVWADGAARPSSPTLTNAPTTQLAGGLIGLAYSNEASVITHLEVE